MADVEEAALSEKARDAEARVGLLRLAVIAVGTVSYPLLDHAGTVPWLAYAVLAVAWLYAGGVVAFKPYLRYPVLASALYTTVSDSLLLMLWVYATGGYASPYWAIMFLSILAIAYRFSLLQAVSAWLVYAALYCALVAGLNQWQGHAVVVFIRLSYLAVGTAVAGLISTQSLEQAQAKLEISRVAETERRLRDEAGRSLSLLSATLESTADGLLVVDLEGRIQSFNRRFAQMWRIPQAVLDARSDTHAIQHVLSQLKEPGAFARKVSELYGQPMAESFDTLEFLDGRVFERYSRPQLIDARPVGRVWSFRDVTERVRAEREREANRARADELERLKAVDAFKSQFINTAAHELNTPLTPIILQLHMLRDSLKGADPRGLDIVHRNVTRLSELVSDLLDAAKYQSGRLVLDAKPCDLGALVTESVESFQEVATRDRVQVRAGVEGRVEARLDRRRVTQVLYNLLSNALKFTPPGGTVLVEASASGTHATVKVTDSGIGVPPEAQAKLFLPFSQLHASTHAGTGLGLYISKGLIEAHGGRIWCHSAGSGKGATFAFTLPLRPDPQVTALAEPSVPSPGA